MLVGEAAAELPVQLICPQTRAPLAVQGGELRGSAVSYRVINGVPDFLGDDGAAGTHQVQTDYVIARRPREGLARRAYGVIVQDLEDEYLRRGETQLGRRLDILDIGCGSSKFLPSPTGGPKRSLELFIRHARKYTGLDPSWSMLEAARAPNSEFARLKNGILVRAVAELLPFASESFDLVFCKSTLDHCADAEAALAEFYRVLRPNTFLLITLQNFSSWQRRVVRTVLPKKYEQHRRKDHHTSPFDPSLLRTQLARAGFVVEELREMGYLNVSRYKLAWLENLLLTLPRVVAGAPAVTKCVRELDAFLGIAAPRLGASMMCWARRS